MRLRESNFVATKITFFVTHKKYYIDGVYATYSNVYHFSSCDSERALELLVVTSKKWSLVKYYVRIHAHVYFSSILLDF